MSATPRPWELVWIGGSWLLREPKTHVVQVEAVDKEIAAFTHRAVNAFDALLAVAKACDLEHDDGWRADELAALAALDAAHPDWRTW